MKHVILSLFLLVFANQAFWTEVPTGNHLVRLVCQKYTNSGVEIDDRVLILEQTSSRTLNTDTAISDSIDGAVLTDPDDKYGFTDDEQVEISMRDFKGSIKHQSRGGPSTGGWALGLQEARSCSGDDCRGNAIELSSPEQDMYGSGVGYAGRVLSGYPTFHDNVGYETGTQLSWISFSTRHHLACRVALSSIHTCAHSLETSWKRSPKLEHVRNTNGSLREEMLSSCPLTAIG